MKIGQIAHAGGKILRRSLLGDLHMPPRLVRIEEHEQIGGAVMLVFIVIRRWCMNTVWVASPPQACVLFDTDGDRHAEAGHLVEGIAGFWLRPSDWAESGHGDAGQ